MSRSLPLCCLALLVAAFAGDAFAQKQVVRQQGGACGTSREIIATCDAGLHCKDGRCAMNSFLSDASRDCRDIMIKAGVITSRETVPCTMAFATRPATACTNWRWRRPRSPSG